MNFRNHLATSILEIPDAIVLATRDRVFPGFFQVFYARSQDGLVQAIFWKKERMQPISGYIFDVSRNLFQYLEGTRIIWTQTSPFNEFFQNFDNRVHVFRQRYQQKKHDFLVFSSISFFQKNGVNFQKLKKGGIR